MAEPVTVIGADRHEPLIKALRQEGFTTLVRHPRNLDAATCAVVALAPAEEMTDDACELLGALAAFAEHGTALRLVVAWCVTERDRARFATPAVGNNFADVLVGTGWRRALLRHRGNERAACAEWSARITALMSAHVAFGDLPVADIRHDLETLDAAVTHTLLVDFGSEWADLGSVGAAVRVRLASV